MFAHVINHAKSTGDYECSVASRHQVAENDD